MKTENFEETESESAKEVEIENGEEIGRMVNEKNVFNTTPTGADIPGPDGRP